MIMLNADGTVNKTGDRLAVVPQPRRHRGPLTTPATGAGTDFFDRRRRRDLRRPRQRLARRRHRPATRCGAAGATTCSTPTTTSTTNGGLNDGPTPTRRYEDRAVGGAGLDVLIANTGGDRLIDWVGEFNSFLVPFAPVRHRTVSRQVPPGLMEFLYALCRAAGRRPDPRQRHGADPAAQRRAVRRGSAWSPSRTTPGRTRPAARATRRPATSPAASATCCGRPTSTTGTLRRLLRRQRHLAVTSGALSVAAASLGEDAAVGLLRRRVPADLLRDRRRVQRRSRRRAGRPTPTSSSTTSAPTDFKFAGIDISTNKLVMGYRDASGWNVVAQTPQAAQGRHLLQPAGHGQRHHRHPARSTARGVHLHLRAARHRRRAATGSTRAWSAWARTTPGASSTTSRCRSCPPQVTYDAHQRPDQGTEQLDRRPDRGTWAPRPAGYTGTAAAGAGRRAGPPRRRDPARQHVVESSSPRRSARRASRASSSTATPPAHYKFAADRRTRPAGAARPPRPARGSWSSTRCSPGARRPVTPYTLMSPSRAPRPASGQRRVRGQHRLQRRRRSTALRAVVRSGSAAFTGSRSAPTTRPVAGRRRPPPVPTRRHCQHDVSVGRATPAAESARLTVSLSQATTAPVTVVVNPHAGAPRPPAPTSPSRR